MFWSSWTIRPLCAGQRPAGTAPGAGQGGGPARPARPAGAGRPPGRRQNPSQRRKAHAPGPGGLAIHGQDHLPARPGEQGAAKPLYPSDHHP